MSKKNEAASQCSGVSGSTGDESRKVVLALERKSVQPFKTQDEYVYAMMEDLSKWLCNLYGVTINPDNFFDVIETGVLLCEHANAVQDCINEEDAKDRVRYKSNAKPGTFLARDNISNFLSWCVRIGIPDDLRFETEDLVLRKHERNVILCLLEVARRGAKYGMLAPQIIQLEQEIDREIAGKTPPIPPPGETNPIGPQPQIKTCALMSLDGMVRDMVSRCCCPSQFPMIKVSDGKYRIGDSKTLIFVRILGNHVMVRIGGGWDTLDNYLNCHDPCANKNSMAPIEEYNAWFKDPRFNNEKTDVTMRLRFKNNTFVGTGSDEIGNFKIKSGELNDGNRITYMKEYDTHRIFYEGVYDGERIPVSAMGKWQLDDIVGQWGMELF